MKVRGHEIALGFLLASFFWMGMLLWQSQQFSQAQENQPPATKSESKTQPSDAAAKPSVTPLQKVEDPQEQRAEQQQNHASRALGFISRWFWRWIGDPNAVFSSVVAAFTVVLGIYTISLAKSTRLAAEAADLSARTAVGVELPIIRIDTPEWVSLSKPVERGSPWVGNAIDKMPTTHTMIPYANLHNRGRSPAFPIEFYIGWHIGRERPEPVTFDYVHNCKGSDCISDGGVLGLEIYFQIELSEGEIARLKDNGEHFWLTASFAYDDFLGDYRELTITWRWSDIGDGRRYHFERVYSHLTGGGKHGQQ